MKRASSKAKRQAVGRSVPTCCSAVSVLVMRGYAQFPEEDDEIRIKICGGMSAGGSDLVLSVPRGHRATEMHIFHTEGEGSMDLVGTQDEYTFKPKVGGEPRQGAPAGGAGKTATSTKL